MTNPQIVRLGGAAGSSPTQPQVKIRLLEPDLQLCQGLYSAGIPQNVVLDVAEALHQKIEMIDENSRLTVQNSDLLQANQRLAERVEHYEAEARRLKNEIKVLTDIADMYVSKSSTDGVISEEKQG